MKIAVLSGKGGTGKTTISTNLATLLKGKTLVDCDVEEPNAHLFFDIKDRVEEPVYTEFPSVDMDRCTLCGKCGEFCNFNAILPAKNRVLVFKESCHACGGCAIVCPENAITYGKREIGKIHSGVSNKGLPITYGALNVGELSGVKVIEELLKSVKGKQIIIDSPPGTSCATVAAVEMADFAIIVTEPTPFGVSDMKMVVEMLTELKIPFGLVINKAGLGNNEIYEYAKQKQIMIIGKIPFDKKIAKSYSTGELISETIPEVKEHFTNIIKNLGSIITSTLGVQNKL